jgi:hypothetical protein
MQIRHDAHMKKRRFTQYPLSVLCGLLLSLDAPLALRAEAPPAAVAAFNAYSKTVEGRLWRQHQSVGGFLALADSEGANEKARLRDGESIIERLSPPAGDSVSGAMLHHWRGTVFAPGAKASNFERLMRDFNSYPQYFYPEVVAAKVIEQNESRMQAWMRVRQRHVITVVMDTSYDVSFGQLDVQHGYNISRSTRMDEVESAGTKLERVLGPNEEHGFIWRLNTYWSFEERDGGLYLQIEAVSLTRDIPRGFGWVIRPYVESIPRESLEFTLRSACNALRKSTR